MSSGSLRPSSPVPRRPACRRRIGSGCGCISSIPWSPRGLASRSPRVGRCKALATIGQGVRLAGGRSGAAAAAFHRYCGCRPGRRPYPRGQSAAKLGRRRRAGRPHRPAGGGDPAHRDRRHPSAVMHHAERRRRSGGADARGAGAKIRSWRSRQRDLGRHRNHDPDRRRGARAANTLSRHLADLSRRAGRGGGNVGAPHGIVGGAYRPRFVARRDADGRRRRPHPRRAIGALVSLRQCGRRRCRRGRGGARGLSRRPGYFG